jgi:uncharacterized membrane protein
MVYGNQVKIAQFLNALAQGFVQTRLEILLFFVFVIVLLLIFVLYFAAQKRMAERDSANRSREILEHRLAELDLSEPQVELLNRMVGFLDNDLPEHVLLVNRHLFDACARRMLQAGAASPDEINALRLSIGFRITRPDEIPASSSELPEGSPVLLEADGGRRLRGTVAAQAPGFMTVELEQGAVPPPTEATLKIYFHNSAGIFSFPTRVIRPLLDAVQLEHSSDIDRFQRRKYYRLSQKLPVYVKPCSARASPRESMLLDLGGGGASLMNPRAPVREGDLLEISFSPKMEKLTLVVRVVRVSRNRRVLHVRFESLSETERSRIMNYLFTQAGERRLRS